MHKLILFFAVLLLGSQLAAQGGIKGRWVTTWATAAAVAVPAPGSATIPSPLRFNNHTLRQIVRTSVAGTQARVVLSNVLGTGPLKLAEAVIALRDKDSAIVVGSAKTLAFGGKQTVTIPAGAVMYSDAVDIKIPALAALVIDVYLPNDGVVGDSPLTMHQAALQTNYVAEGNLIGAPVLPVQQANASWFLLARVEINSSPHSGSVVTLGDSITDGTGSSRNANASWPARLAERLAKAKLPIGVINVGIAGNRLLSDRYGVSALARLERDVLTQTGATHLIVLEGINDIGFASNSPTPTVDDLIVAHRQIITRARARGLKVFGATLTPFEGTTVKIDGRPHFTPEGEVKRQALNHWIRTSKAYDAVIDFDAVTRDPAHPTRFLPAFDSGDHIHPGDAGYQAMANAIDLALLR
jgi:lysophospholipase L1-like esterase